MSPILGTPRISSCSRPLTALKTHLVHSFDSTYGIGQLLIIAVFGVAFHHFLGRADEVGAGLLALVHHDIVECVGMNRIMHHKNNGVALGDFILEALGLPVGEEIVAVVDGHEIDAADDAGGKEQRVLEEGLADGQLLHLVGEILARLADLVAQLMIAHGEEAVDVFKHLLSVRAAAVGEEVDEIAGMQDGHAVCLRIGDGFVPVFLNPVLAVMEKGALQAAGGVGVHMLGIVLVRLAEMGVGQVQDADGSGQADADGGLDKIHIFRLTVVLDG